MRQQRKQSSEKTVLQAAEEMERGPNTQVDRQSTR